MSNKKEPEILKEEGNLLKDRQGNYSGYWEKLQTDIGVYYSRQDEEKSFLKFEASRFAKGILQDEVLLESLSEDFINEIDKAMNTHYSKHTDNPELAKTKSAERSNIEYLKEKALENAGF